MAKDSGQWKGEEQNRKKNEVVIEEQNVEEA